MPLPLTHLRPLLEPRGFHVALLIQASEATDVPGLGDLAESVRLGQIPPTTPEVVAVAESTGGYPPVAIAVAITDADARLLLAGDLVTARDVVAMLADARDAFLVEARRGRFT